jgi:peroxiredoxin
MENENGLSTAETHLPPQGSIWIPWVVKGLILGAVVGIWWYQQLGEKPTANLAGQANADLEARNFKPLSGSVQALIADKSKPSIPTQSHPLLFMEAPDFTLADVEGADFHLAKEAEGAPIVLVFYYGYSCSHCVSQLFGLAKDIGIFRELGAKVIAISPDSKELTKERYAEYGTFPFRVLSDPGNKVAQLYSTYIPAKNPMDDGELMHGTFVIFPGGKVIWANRGDEPFTNNLTLIRTLTSKLPNLNQQ